MKKPVKKGTLKLFVDEAAPNTKDVSAMVVARQKSDGTFEVVKTISPYKPWKPASTLRLVENN